MQGYSRIIDAVESNGYLKGDRTQTGTRSTFGVQERFSLRNFNLPVVTGKFTHMHSVEHELFWMISGSTKVGYLLQNGVRIWNEWVKPESAVYQILKHQDLFDQLEKKLGKHILFVFSAGQTDTFTTHPIEEYLSDISDAAEEAFWKQYPEMTQAKIDEIRTIVEIDVVAWSKTIGNEWAPLPAYLEEDTAEEFAYRLYRLVFNSNPRKLVDGDLGAVYGKTWRDIEDTRVIPKVEWTDYEKRGFSFVVDIPGDSMETDQCVVTRRIDQLQDVINQLTNNPDSRRIIICAWAPQLVDEQALPPCHSFIQFWTRELSIQERLDFLITRTEYEETLIPTRGKQPLKDVEAYKTFHSAFFPRESMTEEWVHNHLDQGGVPRRAISCQLYQRSCDLFLGVPFNIMFYSMFTHMLANQFNMAAEEFIWTGGDVHIYSNHVEQMAEYKTLPQFETPTIRFKPEVHGKDVREITQADYEILNYVHGPRIAAKVAV